MLAMALTMPDEHQHIAGVLALGVITAVPLAACWLPVLLDTHVDGWLQFSVMQV